MGEDRVPDINDEAVVTYTVRELLANIDRAQTVGFTEMKAALANKVDKADLARIETELASHAQDIGALKTWKHDTQLTKNVHNDRNEASATWKYRLVRAAWAVIGVAALVLGPYLGSHL